VIERKDIDLVLVGPRPTLDALPTVLGVPRRQGRLRGETPRHLRLQGQSDGPGHAPSPRVVQMGPQWAVARTLSSGRTW